MQSAERRSERRVRARRMRVSVRGDDRVLARGKSAPYMYTAFQPRTEISKVYLL
jgi:hypothetical protein